MSKKTEMAELNDTFELDGVFYVIKKTMFESRETHIERAYFILNMLKKDKRQDLHKLIVLSKVLANVKNLGCTYSTSLMDKL